MNKYLPINKVVESISITHKFNKPSLLFLNTSDIERGKIINKKYLPISELKGQAKKTIKKDDILFSEIRPKNRRFAYVDIEDTEDYVVSTKLMVLRNINQEVDNKYFYYFLTSDSMLNILQNRAENRICSFPQITFDLLSDYKIRVPEIREQHRIASVLSTLDAKIDLNNRINAELESIAKMLYGYWFVQFDFPDRNGRPYKSSGGKMAWNAELKQEIPEGWEVKRIDEVASVKAGGDRPKLFSLKKTDSCKIPIYSNGIQDDGLYGYTNEATINNQSVTVSARGTIGYAVLRNKPFVPIIRLIVITPYTSGSAQFFLEHIKRINFNKSGSVQQQLTVPQVSSLNIAYPPQSTTLEEFNKATSPFIKKIEMIKEENRQLEELRDWLLPMLMNGQVKVT